MSGFDFTPEQRAEWAEADRQANLAADRVKIALGKPGDTVMTSDGQRFIIADDPKTGERGLLKDLRTRKQRRRDRALSR